MKKELVREILWKQKQYKWIMSGCVEQKESYR